MLVFRNMNVLAATKCLNILMDPVVCTEGRAYLERLVTPSRQPPVSLVTTYFAVSFWVCHETRYHDIGLVLLRQHSTICMFSFPTSLASLLSSFCTCLEQMLFHSIFAYPRARSSPRSLACFISCISFSSLRGFALFLTALVSSYFFCGFLFLSPDTLAAPW